MHFRLKYQTIIITAFLLFGAAIPAIGNNNPIDIYSACLNQDDSTVTLKFTGANNPCGTFSKIIIRGRAVQSVPLPFSTVQTITNLPATATTIKQTDLRQREYFLEYLYACNGTDTIRSDTFAIDFTPPNGISIDSVSVDLASQRVRIGWPQNTSDDYVGYIIYVINGQNNVRIHDQNTEGYIHPTSNPGISPISYTYNVFDSCDNKNPLADVHGTIHLTRRYDFCLREITLNWTPYIGWQTDYYSVYMAINGAPYEKITETSNLTFTVNNIQNGANYCFYIRSHKDNSTFTSSSNRVCQATPNPPIPTNTFINSIAVSGENQINLNWSTANPQTSFPAQIYRGTNQNNLSIIGSMNYNAGANTFQDNNVTSSNNSYFYQIIIPDSCQENNDSSLINESIYLDVNQGLLTWNSYIFETGSNISNIVMAKQNGSTWNIFENLGSNTDNANIPEDTARCYRIYSVSDLGDTSISNVICIEEDLKISIPSAIKPGSSIQENQVFRIYGTGIDWEKTTIAIYDRWGGKIAELNKDVREWNPITTCSNIPTGLYLYTGYVFGLKNEKKFVKGQITVLR